MVGVTSGPDAAARVRAAAYALAEAAHKDDIEPDGALGNWVQAQQLALLCLADGMDDMRRGVGDAIENVRELAVAEVHRLRKATDLAAQTTEALRLERDVLKLNADHVVADFMKSAEPKLIDALTSVTVIRERAWNRRQNLTGVGVAALTLCVVYAVGFLSGGGNFQSHAPGVAAEAAVERCRTAAKADRAGGEMWCPVKTLDEPS